MKFGFETFARALRFLRFVPTYPFFEIRVSNFLLALTLLTSNFMNAVAQLDQVNFGSSSERSTILNGKPEQHIAIDSFAIDQLGSLRFLHDLSKQALALSFEALAWLRLLQKCAVLFLEMRLWQCAHCF